MKPIKVTIIGISIDLGLLGNTWCSPEHSIQLWLFIGRIVPALIVWQLRLTPTFQIFPSNSSYLVEITHRTFNPKWPTWNGSKY